MIVWIYIAIYWVWYFWARLALVHHGKWAGIKFLGNLLFGLYAIVIVQGDLLRQWGMTNGFLNLNLWLMAVGIILHHLAVVAQYKGYGVIKLEKIHGQISHLLMFVPYGISSVFVGLARGDYLFIVVSVGIAITGVLVGLRKITLRPGLLC